MLHECDIAVVGSGPAGAACALGLARLGFSTALIDERGFPRTKVCGEYLNSGAVRELRELGIGAALESQVERLRGMRLFAHDEEAEFHFSRDAWSLPRRTLDDAMRTASIAAGAVAVHARLRAVARDAESVTLSVTNADDVAHEIRARYAVGADGMRSAMARLCNLTAPTRGARYATGGHYRNVALHGWIEMYASPSGYLALNPLDETSANVMFVVSQKQLMQSRGALNAELARFSDALTRGARPLDDSMLCEERRAIGPLSHRTIAPTASRVLLVGDAAAFVDPFSGQGVYLALLGARAAVSALSQAMTDREGEERAWREYAKTIRATVAERQRVTFLMKAMLMARAATRRAASRLRSRPAAFEPLIEAVCGNTTAPSAPRLAVSLARALR